MRFRVLYKFVRFSPVSSASSFTLPSFTYSRAMATASNGNGRPVSPLKADIENLRPEYHSDLDHFDIDKLAYKDPIAQFEVWLQDVVDSKESREPNAMAVATCDPETLLPSVRMVLLKKVCHKTGFTFYTNYESKKSSEISRNNKVALLFYWEQFNRQVRIEGTCTRTSSEEADEYWSKRPHISQIGSSASDQHSIVPDRATMAAMFEAEYEKYPNGKTPVPRPQNWGGYRVLPTMIEFWQGQTSRFHDRLIFTKSASGDCPPCPQAVKGDNGWWITRKLP